MGEAITYSYSLTQWILFFFWYCFLGWIWECLFVSVKRAWKNKKWEFVNRGFLNGPLIPIYGFAAITILLATIQVRENTIAIYVLGALTATLFEMVTGTVMERLFKVKYWDYSDMPLNYHGHICLFVSLFWGAFSVLLVRIIHVPVENLLMQVPSFLCEAFAFVFMAIFAYDTTVSFNEAMDLREVLESLSENNETVKRLERRFDAIVAFTPVPDIDEINELKLRLEKLEMHRKRIMEKSNKQFLRAMNQLKRNPGAKSEKYQEMMELLYKLLENRD